LALQRVGNSYSVLREQRRAKTQKLRADAIADESDQYELSSDGDQGHGSIAK
jgi:hypothetical protein